MSMGSTAAQGMVKITGYGGHCVKKGCRRQRISKRGALARFKVTVTVGQEDLVNREHWTGLVNRVPRTSKVNRVQRTGFSLPGAEDRFTSTGWRGQVKSTECRGQVSKQFVVTGSSQQGAEDMSWSTECRGQVSVNRVPRTSK
jgi:hypothetical protein